mmetsp:Transcript_95227/g.269014  ORF Transcript_95227/g.269014 Transcript_95227/m.269014 type:complete len:440 (+) Transcript_95227:2376-3695(+)
MGAVNGLHVLHLVPFGFCVPIHDVYHGDADEHVPREDALHEPTVEGRMDRDDDIAALRGLRQQHALLLQAAGVAGPAEGVGAALRRLGYKLWHQRLQGDSGKDLAGLLVAVEAGLVEVYPERGLERDRRLHQGARADVELRRLRPVHDRGGQEPAGEGRGLRLRGGAEEASGGAFRRRIVEVVPGWRGLAVQVANVKTKLPEQGFPGGRAAVAEDAHVDAVIPARHHEGRADFFVPRRCRSALLRLCLLRLAVELHAHEGVAALGEHARNLAEALCLVQPDGQLAEALDRGRSTGRGDDAALERLAFEFAPTVEVAPVAGTGHPVPGPVGPHAKLHEAADLARCLRQRKREPALRDHVLLLSTNLSEAEDDMANNRRKAQRARVHDRDLRVRGLDLLWPLVFGDAEKMPKCARGHAVHNVRLPRLSEDLDPHEGVRRGG